MEDTLGEFKVFFMMLLVSTVLILIVMEDTLGDLLKFYAYETRKVLVLIVMEDTLGDIALKKC